jgi:hypothetical protein
MQQHPLPPTGSQLLACYNTHKRLREQYLRNQFLFYAREEEAGTCENREATQASYWQREIENLQQIPVPSAAELLENYLRNYPPVHTYVFFDSNWCYLCFLTV